MDNITGSKAWAEGFVKAAADAGLPKEQVALLYKHAVHLYGKNSDMYLHSMQEEITKQAFAPQGSTFWGAIRDTLSGFSPFGQQAPRPGSSEFMNRQLTSLGSNRTLSDEDRYTMLAELMRSRKHMLQSQLGAMSV